MIIKENFRKYEGLNQHTTYSFRVWVVTEKGIGNPSTEMSATTFEGGKLLFEFSQLCSSKIF